MDRHYSMKSLLGKAFVPMMAMAILGCGQFEAENAFSKLGEVSQNGKFETTERPQCEVDFSDYELDTHLLAFEMTDKTDISFGFNLLNGFFRALGFKLKLQRGKMVAGMEISETLVPSMTVAHVLGTGESKENEFRIDLDAIQLGIDIGYYYKTPLFKLTEKTLRGSLSNLRDELKSVETKWHTKIVWKKDNFEFIVPTGSVAGLREGDQFQVYNVEYVWRQKPCESELIMARKTTEKPVAIAQVMQIEKNASLLKVIDSLSDAPIEVGSILEIQNLPLRNKKDIRELKHSVRIMTVESEKLAVPGAKDIDLTIYLREQLGAVLSDYGLYPRQ